MVFLWERFDLLRRSQWLTYPSLPHLWPLRRQGGRVWCKCTHATHSRPEHMVDVQTCSEVKQCHIFSDILCCSLLYHWGQSVGMIHESGLDTKLGPGFKDTRGAASGFLVSLCKTGVTELCFLRGLMWRKMHYILWSAHLLQQHAKTQI